MMLASVHDVVKAAVDLGVPGLVGAALGSVLTYLFGRRLLDEQAARDLSIFAAQVERDAADQVERALNRVHITARDVPADNRSSWGRLHNQWQDEALMPAARIRNPEIQERITAVGQAIFYAFQYPDEGLAYGVLHSIENATAGLRAFLANESLPPSFFPTSKGLHDLMWHEGGGRPNLDAYRDWLADHPSVG
jgi:hypothetical protein